MSIRMNKNERQIIAEKVGSTVRVLELLGFSYEVTGPQRKKEKGNSSPRVIHVDVADTSGKKMRVYNGFNGSTWANQPNGDPISKVKSPEGLYNYLVGLKKQMKTR